MYISLKQNRKLQKEAVEWYVKENKKTNQNKQPTHCILGSDRLEHSRDSGEEPDIKISDLYCSMLTLSRASALIYTIYYHPIYRSVPSSIRITD